MVQRYSAAASAASCAEYWGPISLVGCSNAGSFSSTSVVVSTAATSRSPASARQLLLDDVADHPLRLRAEYVERVGRDVLVREILQREKSHLRPVAVGDDDLVLAGQARQGLAGCSPTFARNRSAVIGSPRRASALPPRATTMRTEFLLRRVGLCIAQWNTRSNAPPGAPWTGGVPTRRVRI